MSVAALLNYTYDDYIHWEGEWELIEGVAVSMAPAPMKIHQRLAAEIFKALHQGQEDECSECEILYEIDWHKVLGDNDNSILLTKKRYRNWKVTRLGAR